MIALNLESVLQQHPPASSEDLEECCRQLQQPLPDKYRQFLQQYNGLVFNEGTTLFGTADLLERQLTLEVAEYAPGYIAIADDGGGYVFLMAQKTDATSVYRVDVGDMTIQNSARVTEDVLDWVSNGCPVGNVFGQEWPTECAIWVKSIPDGGLRHVLQLKNRLGLTLSAGEVFKRSQSLPFLLAEKAPYGKVQAMLRRFDSLQDTIELKPSNEESCG